ncbi:hypothetical protein ACIQ7Q_07995 [Streptomyces sp. NPDC096176]|uniref:hypothetical protein n=1 Tax=Streptomyces sp. NPDC096176 TaxID=3366079 RepID=UPI0037FBA6FC
MADLMDVLPFKTLVTQTSAVLLTHGVVVGSTSVQGVEAHLVETMAQQVGMDHEQAAQLVTPEAVAEIIMKAMAEEYQGAAAPHAVRPVRIDNRAVQAPVESLGNLIMAASQAGKYTGLNDDGVAAAHLLTSSPRSGRPREASCRRGSGNPDRGARRAGQVRGHGGCPPYLEPSDGRGHREVCR